MSDQPYTLIVNASGVLEQHLGTCGSEAEHCPGDISLDFITAVGSTPVFAYHAGHAPAVISLAGPPGTSTCICDVGTTGQMCEPGGVDGCIDFVKECLAAPNASLLEQRNPTCNSKQYAGGLRCC